MNPSALFTDAIQPRLSEYFLAGGWRPLRASRPRHCFGRRIEGGWQTVSMGIPRSGRVFEGVLAYLDAGVIFDAVRFFPDPPLAASAPSSRETPSFQFVTRPTERATWLIRPDDDPASIAAAMIAAFEANAEPWLAARTSVAAILEQLWPAVDDRAAGFPLLRTITILLASLRNTQQLEFLLSRMESGYYLGGCDPMVLQQHAAAVRRRATTELL